MKVFVVFEYSHVDNPNSAEAEDIVMSLTADCKRWEAESGADNVYIDEAVVITEETLQ